MTTGKKKRLSMLDNIAAAGSAPATPSMMASNGALRSARDAVDSHHVWELDPFAIDDTRPADRLDTGDIWDLRDAIETNGQTVPILVRRNPTVKDRYLLVYGRRRLEAIRQSDKVTKVRALVAAMDDTAAVTAQISENMARRDLSYIEKALFARELVETGFGTQSHVAEILTVTKSAISMALAVVDAVTPELARAIGAAHGIGRPRWEALAKAITETGPDPETLVALAQQTRDSAEMAIVVDGSDQQPEDPSLAAFDAVMQAATPPAPPKNSAKSTPKAKSRPLTIDGARTGTVRKSASGLRLDLPDSPFADWLDIRLEATLNDLHERWKKRTEDERPEAVKQ